jgi:tetratricopeptide (TPR) repeat protein/transcriptional regulator with XRE-family HTH domain
MFGRTVREHRLRRGLSQEELAGKAGIGVKTIGNIEAGRNIPRVSTVRLLADALGLAGAERDRFCAMAAAGPAEPGSAVPAQLPMDVYGFTGRSAQLDTLDSLTRAGSRQPTAVLITAIDGTAGIGKTALAVHWAHRVADRFPDGQLYANLRGFTPTGTPTRPEEAVRGFLDALGIPSHRIPAGLDAQVMLYRSRLAGKKVLVVLDNARDVDQVRPLLPGAPGCAVVVTSRNRLTPLVAAEGAHPINLGVLSPEEARSLLVHRLGPARVAAEPDAVEAIVSACARLPLALAIVAARAVMEPELSLAALAGQLAGTDDGLDVLSAGDPTTDVRAVFSWSYRTLSAEAGRLFRLLGLHHGPDITVSAAASLAALPRAEVRPLLAELVGANLISEPGADRYAVHDLLRAYAGDLARHADPDDQRRAATHRILDHYLHTAHAASRLMEPTQGPIPLDPPQPGVTTDELGDQEQALAWLTGERAALLAAVDQAAAAGFPTHAGHLAEALYLFLDRRGHWTDQVRVQLVAAQASRRLGDPAGGTRAHRNIAAAQIRLGRFDEARAHLQEAIELAARAGDLVACAYAHYNLAYLWDQRQDRTAALSHNQQAMALFQAAGHRQGQARTLSAVGWYQTQLGDHRAARATCQEAIALLEELDDRFGLAGTWDSLGYAHRHLGDHAEAIACYRRAVELSRDLGNRYYEASALTHLGDTHDALGDRDAARDAWHQALAILADLDHRDAEDVRDRLQRLDTRV